MRRRTPIGHCQPITSSGRKTLRRCKNNEEVDNVVLIDVDSDDNVIIIDVPEPVQQKLRGSSVVRKDKDGPFQTVICIDDDETADNNTGEFSSDGSSNTKSCPALNHCRNSVDGKFGQENTSPVKLSKCKRTYSGKGYTTKRYGLSPESTSTSSDDDTPDCMVMEDSYREQWEKASLKKKSEVHKGQSCMGDQASASKLHSDAHHNLETEDTGCSSSGNASSEEEIETGYSNLGSTSHSPKKSPFTDFGLKSTEKTQFSRSKVDVQDRGESLKHVEHSGSSFCNEEELSSPGPPLFSTEEQGHKQVNRANFFSWDKEKPPPVEPCLSNSEPTVDINLCSTKASLSNEDDFLCKSKNSVETMVDRSRVVSRNEGEKFQQVNPSVAPGAVPKETLCQSRSSGGMGISYEEANYEEKGKAVPKEPCLGDIRFSEADIVEGKSLVIERDNALNLGDGDVTLSDQECLINEREKLKETDEYKRAVEEEWASRQRELQIQAEEAQQLRRLRKRKKAESMRLLDMERRQKQRLEEIRETQKKDEENMNLKEQLRAEVRKDLNMLEMTCSDMVSLLRGLGIDVNLPNEVRAAYKRALLSFHPDRASGSDIRQLVEAEEKFKLISRMKEKFLSTS